MNVKRKISNIILAIVLSFTALLPQFVLADDEVLKDNNSNIETGGYSSQSIWYSAPNERMSGTTFTANSSYYASSVSLYVKRVGNPSGLYNIGIKAIDENNIPTGNFIAYWQGLVNGLSTSYAWVNFEFDAWGSITASDNYSVVVEPVSWGTDSSNCLSWRATYEANFPYIGETVYESDVVDWGNNFNEVGTQDQMFKVFGSGSSQENEVSISETPSVHQTESGNFTVSFSVYISPANFSDNVSAVLVSAGNADLTQDAESDSWFSDDIALNNVVVSSDNSTFIFTSENPYLGMLVANTVYYYQGRAELGGTVYYSDIKSFSTPLGREYYYPTVDMYKITDESVATDTPYTFEAIAQASTANMTGINIIGQGFEISLSSEDNTILDEPIYSYNVNFRDIYNQFTLLFTLNTNEDYGGETFYIRAYLNTDIKGKIYSSIVAYTPSSLTGGVSSGVKEISDLFSGAKTSLGLTGTMGTWAFMGLLLLIVALIFGTLTLVQKDETTRKAISIVWALISIAIVGGFIFTGELGVWPIVILVCAVAFFAMVVGGIFLSGRRADG